jgi:ATP phosphoribosyltransferase
MLTIALSKGRILKETLPLLATIGIEISDDELNSRKLILDSNDEDIKIIVLRATDVPVFVQHGVADIGVSGKDVIEEKGYMGIYELLDLQISKCRMMVAAKSASDIQKNLLKVATKYPNTAKNYFNKINRQVEIIKLYGAMELAPVVGLSDCIVDLVDTGNTLKANGLKAFDEISSISSRLIVNISSYKSKNIEIKDLVESLEKNL